MHRDLAMCFTDEGNLRFDAYRERRHPFWETIFAGENHPMTYEGCLADPNQLRDLIQEKGWAWNCDAVGLYHADRLGRNTKGSYPTVYYFR